MREERPTFGPDHFRRADESDDAHFYTMPRFVQHIDDAAIAAATEFYRATLPQSGAILDLMSSWVSHLPHDARYREVVGLGMNEEELRANRQLTEYIVQDLNQEPVLPFEDGRFDGAVMTVSVQYLTQPVEVFAEVGRVLGRGTPLIVTYSNRCFPTKAVAIWQFLDNAGHGRLVQEYLAASGAFFPAEVIDLSPAPGRSDPLFAVVARRRAEGRTRPPE